MNSYATMRITTYKNCGTSKVEISERDILLDRCIEEDIVRLMDTEGVDRIELDKRLEKVSVLL